MSKRVSVHLIFVVGKLGKHYPSDNINPALLRKMFGWLYLVNGKMLRKEKLNEQLKALYGHVKLNV